ncbi:MAG: carbamoyl-phosphate synthase large subunit, partial [Pseudomonadales bacterium]|nr:carbamoyl-phosphate synthase large subunit [Pseudomonadales bacterium]
SSALASKATGFPIAKVAAKLAVGYTLDELTNDITAVTPASFEPSIDYVVTKIPRFTFEKFAQADARLTTQMKSVGEVMAIGRTFQESLQKALRGLEVGAAGLDPQAPRVESQDDLRRVIHEITTPGAERIWHLGDAFRAGLTLEEVFDYSFIDPWFLAQIEDLILEERRIAGAPLASLDEDLFRRLKRKGFSDARLAALLNVAEDAVRARRQELGLRPVYRRVDTCAAEFPASTAYMYSTYEDECEAAPSDRDKIMVLGGGPNRIGQGIEFDYCCVHAALAMREDGYETIMVNCNPETVSTDYDTSDRLYFEPVTLEDVLAIVDLERPKGVIVQFGGQTPLKLVEALEAAGVPIMGTSADSIDRAEDRERFKDFIVKLGLTQPDNRIVRSEAEAADAARQIGYPLVVRPSYVLGGRAMEIVYGEDKLERYMLEAVRVSDASPVLLDRFLDQAVEVDVDAVCDGERVVIGGIMEHIEQAGVHSGDSACALPPHHLGADVQARISDQVRAMALELGVVGLMNVQLAIQNGEIFVLEVNPRASRTVPFVSKAIGTSLAKIAARCMAGTSLEAQGFTEQVSPDYVCVKESVFPFAKFPGVDPILGPEMKSTGEVMGVGDSFDEAFAKATLGASIKLPEGGRCFLSVKESDKPFVVPVARELLELGFSLVCTRGTRKVLAAAGIDAEQVNKVTEGRPDISDELKNRRVDFIINTTEGRQSIADSAVIRRLALQYKVCYTTTLTGGVALCTAIRFGRGERVRRLQDLHAGRAA